MAWPTFTAQGRKNGGSDDFELYQKQYAGEVLTSFHANTVFDPLVRVRNIRGAKSATFPVVGTLSASHHIPGTQIDGQSVKNNEIEITVDYPMVAPIWISNYHEALIHYEVRSIYSGEQGQALGQMYDKYVAIKGLLAARATKNNLGDNRTPTVVKDPSMATTAANIISGLYSVAKTWDTLNVPKQDRFCVLGPTQWYLLAQSTGIYNRDYGTSAGNYSEVVLPPVAGFKIVQSNNLPSTNITTNPTGVNSDYKGDFSDTLGLCFQRGAVGVVKLMDLTVESEYSVAYQGDLVVSKMCVGMGTLQPDFAAELSKASAT